MFGIGQNNATPSGAMQMLKTLGIDPNELVKPVMVSFAEINDRFKGIQESLKRIEKNQEELALDCDDICSRLDLIEMALAKGSPDEKYSDQVLSEHVDAGIVSLEN